MRADRKDRDAPTGPLDVPEFSLVLLVGSTSSGKSTFARKHFKATETVSSDACRAAVCDDENALDANEDAFALLGATVDLRLKRRKLAVVDATNLRREGRERLVAIAKARHALAVAIVVDPGEAACRARAAARPDRDHPPHVIKAHHDLLRRLKGMRQEGFHAVHHLSGERAVEEATVVRRKLWTDLGHETSPLDVVGDVHGCMEELLALLRLLGWDVARGETGRWSARHPGGRKAVFVGDLVDRGPDVGGVLSLVMDMVEDGVAYCVAGNHEAKLEKWLRGRPVTRTHGIQESIDAIEAGGRDFRERVRGFVSGLRSHLTLDGGKLAVAHAGIREDMVGRASGAVRAFCLYGDVTGERDEHDLPVRGDWARDYRGPVKVVYGHTPVARAEWVNGTLCLDTGCVFGGSLTALRWPETETVSVPAARTYVEPSRPFIGSGDATAQQAVDADLDAADVTGQRTVETALMTRISVRAENAAAALETMSRHAVDPRWLVYLPPTMSPAATSTLDGWLEHPAEAFAHYRSEGVATVLCEEKHMGSRAVMAVCRDAGTAAGRFGVEDGSLGEVWTRTGRPFFDDPGERAAVVGRASAALAASGTFEATGSDWAVLDVEVMPWSAKAMALVRGQYGPVAAAGRVGLGLAHDALARAAARGLPVDGLLDAVRAREGNVTRFAQRVSGYCWPSATVDDLAIAPFHLLATEGKVHSDATHAWHMSLGPRMAAADHLFRATRTFEVDLSSPESEAAAIAWWEAMTAAGGEGMVVKPPTFLARGAKRLCQPAVKVRGKDYLRIVYGPDYDMPANLERLRERSLNAKRSLAMREFALGLEGLERFVRGEPLRRVHECAFAVLALESEPVDPRL